MANMCEECNEELHRYTDPNTGREGYSCDLCGWSWDDNGGGFTSALFSLPVMVPYSVMQSQIDAAVLAEREACAKEADYYAAHSQTARQIAAAIRARGKA
jgi:hypothetical protein